MPAVTSQGGKPAFGNTHADVRDFGAATALVDNSAAIQAAHDSLLGANTTLSGGTNLNTGVVYVPAGSWKAGSPIWLDGDNITLRGEGPDCTSIKAVSNGPVLIVGHKRRTQWNSTARDTEALTGTLAFTTGSAVVTGTSTVFRDQLMPGSQLYLNSDGTHYTVKSIQSDTALTLTANFAGTTASGAATRDMAYLAGMTAAFAADHRVDCYGKLDTSVATAPGQRWGVTSKSASSGSPYGEHFVSVSAGPPQNGLAEGWHTVKTLVVDAAIEGPIPVGGGTAGPPQGRALFGMGSYLDPDPWQLDQYTEPAVGHRVFRFTFYTADANGYKHGISQARSFYFGNVDTLTGVTKLTVQVDFTKNQDGSTGNQALCAIHCWVNGVEQSVTRGFGTRNTTVQGNEPSFTAADGWTYQLNEVGPFQVFNNDVSQNSWNPTGDVAYHGTFQLYGLYVGTGADYITSGGVQARADAGTLDDSYRYTGAHSRSTANLVAYLSLTTPPTADWAGKIVTFQSGTAAGSILAPCGLFCHAGDSNPAVSNLRVRDLAVSANVTTAGRAIQVGQCLGLTFQNVSAAGGWQGIGGMNVGATYVIRFVGYNAVSGNDCGLYANAWIIRADDFNVGFTGFAGVRLVQCDARIRSIMGSSYTRSIGSLVKIKQGGYASTYEIGETWVDQESLPAFPAIIAERHNTGLTMLTVGRLGSGARDATTPQVQLIDWWPTTLNSGTGPARLNLKGVLNNAGVIVQTVGQWEGEVSELPSTIGSTTQPIQSIDASPASKVISVHYLDDIPNNISGATGSVWLKGAHIIRRRNPPGGGWTVAVCTGSGTVGGTAPTWQTFNTVP